MSALLKRSLVVSEIVHCRLNCYNLKQEEGIKQKGSEKSYCFLRNKKGPSFSKPGVIDIHGLHCAKVKSFMYSKQKCYIS